MSRRIAVSTGGGDAPGLNAVIRAVVLSARGRGWEVLGIRRGYSDLLDGGEPRKLNSGSVRGITHLGGTILGTASRGNPFQFPVVDEAGEVTLVDRSDEVLRNFERHQLDALIVIGGDGSMRIAQRFADLGIPIVGVPKTIDNDLEGTVFTFGFHTAVSVATEAIGRLHSTAEAHERVFICEVMGRYAGWIALYAGLASTADVILIPEVPYELDSVAHKIRQRERDGHHFTIIVAAEGAHPRGGEMSTRGDAEPGREVRLGGIGEKLARDIHQATGKECRSVVLGHLQRGGEPAAYDRIIALQFGAAAVEEIEKGNSNVMVSLQPPRVTTVPLAQASSGTKNVTEDSDSMRTARALGTCFGD